LILLYYSGREAANKGKLRFSPSETKGIVGSPNSEMAMVNTDHNVFIPPVQLSSLSDFKNIAGEAAVVVYSPEYFQGPFMDDHKRLRRLTLTAVGVRKNGLPLTFRYVLDDVRDIDRVASEILEDLEVSGNVVQGSMERSHPFGDLLATWP